MKKRSLIIVILIFTTLLLGSCIVIPHNDPDPFPQETITKLETSHTTRAEVEKLLGPPDTRRSNDRYWLYFGRQRLYSIVTGGLGGGHSDTKQENWWLVLSFDTDNRLVRIEKIKDPAKKHTNKLCSEDGVCVYEGTAKWASSVKNYPIPSFEEKAVMVLAPEDRDKKAKSYTPNPSMCQAFVYATGYDEEWPENFRLQFRLDGIDQVDIRHGLYAWSEFRPGRHHLLTGFKRWRGGKREERTTGYLDFQCVPGSVLFIHVHQKYRYEERFPDKIQLVDEATGRQAISSRLLRLSH